MPEPPEPSADDLLDRMRQTPGLASLVAEAVRTWRHRCGQDGQPDGPPAREVAAQWRAFTDAFPTFWEFTNRPR